MVGGDGLLVIPIHISFLSFLFSFSFSFHRINGLLFTALPAMAMWKSQNCYWKRSPISKSETRFGGCYDFLLNQNPITLFFPPFYPLLYLPSPALCFFVFLSLIMILMIFLTSFSYFCRKVGPPFIWLPAMATLKS